MKTQYPNAGQSGRNGRPIIAVVVHYTGGHKQGDLATLGHRTGKNDVSAHYWIGVDGEVVPIVPEDRAAWHAGHGGPMQIGKVCVPADKMNLYSIGIECEGSGCEWPLEQLSALTTLILEVIDRHPIAAVMGHQHWAGPARKPDPGPKFPWASLRSIIPPEVWVASTGCAGRVAQIPTTPTGTPVAPTRGSGA